MKTDIIIGANFGDEGKGLVTDFYAAQAKEKCLVVRHNSSAQAGHTVTTADGKRHVFGHIGAGSFNGASTYLSRFFVCHPLLFAKEYQTLAAQCHVPRIYADRQCLISTPYDMIINQMVEALRGDKRHGSCGVGFGETIVRNQSPQYGLKLGDLDDLGMFLQKLLDIRHEWLPKRLLALGIGKIPAPWIARIESKQLLADFIDATGFFLRTARMVNGLPHAGFDHIVFEGAQGLLLDQDHAYFPHVTRSSTGIKNAMTILDAAGIHDAHITYVSRAYITRHGAGPLPHEEDKPIYAGIVDATNITNTYQGALRFALPDIDAIATAIHHDLGFVPLHMRATFGLAVTCADQINGAARFIKDGRAQTGTADDLLRTFHDTVGGVTPLVSFGPTRDDVQRLSTPALSPLVKEAVYG